MHTSRVVASLDKAQLFLLSSYKQAANLQEKPKQIRIGQLLSEFF